MGLHFLGLKMVGNILCPQLDQMYIKRLFAFRLSDGEIIHVFIVTDSQKEC